MKEYQISLQYPTEFWLGDSFYKAGFGKGFSVDKEQFVSICPSCNNTRRIKYTGYDGNTYEAECPICKGSNMCAGYGNRIEIYNWRVEKYIVYKIFAQGAPVLSAYKDGALMNNVELKAFYRFGRAEDDFIECTVPCNKIRNHVDQEIASINLSEAKEWQAEEYIFRKKKDAEEFCRALKEYDKKCLQEFNSKYHTSYEYPY